MANVIELINFHSYRVTLPLMRFHKSIPICSCSHLALIFLPISDRNDMSWTILLNLSAQSSYQWPTKCPNSRARQREEEKKKCIKWKPFQNRFNAKWTTIYLTVQTTCVVDALTNNKKLSQIVSVSNTMKNVTHEPRGHKSISQKWKRNIRFDVGYTTYTNSNISANENWRREKKNIPQLT